MDLRVARTRRHIISAFLDLRAQKPLERITIKDLAARAEINKATFYLHFHDIYDLSDAVEQQIVSSVIDRIDHPENLIFQPSQAIRDLTDAYLAQKERIDVVFSGEQRPHLVKRIDQSIRQSLYEKYPQWREDRDKNIMLTYCIYGSYHAFMGHLHYGIDDILPAICRISDALRDLY
ncbi:MAG TPA: TetR/AcrR family transcriptional regulator [Candidatus Flavonifractor merdigallinarum]|uniref:TetR/AcrR family transcriptional regulator n=1 Tax=Candidatus Flavonifractor merdigallinarum TaxID=2838589 RepID=A0A9D2BYV1_9FIRM|nr:TetR/AcrR family transcriptional regulator [Candidatus Flavonifractor merdigallinarum]